MQIPKQLQNPDFRFVLLGKPNIWKHKKTGLQKSISPEEYRTFDSKEWTPLGKAPFEKAWQQGGYAYNDDKLLNHIALGNNVGVNAGHGGLLIVDIDDSQLGEELESKMNTFTIKTGSGGRHFYFYTKEEVENEVLANEKGEIRAKNYQAVCAGCLHPSGNYYTIIQDKPLAEITKQQLLDILKPYLRQKVPENFQKPLVLEQKSQDTSRSGLEYRKIIALLREGKTQEEIYNLMMSYSKWAESDDKYRDFTFNKAANFVKQEQQQKKELLNKLGDNSKPLSVRTIKEILKIKPDKSCIVQGFVYPKTTIMLHSPPAYFKSLVAFYMGLCVASGKDFLGFKTKKSPVLYCDGENNDTTMKERLEKIMKGQDIKSSRIPFFNVKRGVLIDEDKSINKDFVNQIFDFVKKNKVRLVVFDTLHRFAFYDENKADDLNKLYTQVFQPLQDLGCSVLFLHHSTKKGGYRGSSDFQGMVDTAYTISRNSKTAFTIINSKARGGEIDNINAEIDFGEDYIKFLRVGENKEENNSINKLKEVTSKIKSYFKIGVKLSRKDIISKMQMEEPAFEYGSVRTIARALKFLVDNGYLDKTDKTGEYSLILR